MSKYFENVEGTIELKDGVDFPEDMTDIQAMDILIGKAGFGLSELKAGRRVDDESDCPFCAIYNGRNGNICNGCPRDSIYFDTRKNNSFRIPNVRRVLNKLKAIRSGMED